MKKLGWLTLGIVACFTSTVRADIVTNGTFAFTGGTNIAFPNLYMDENLTGWTMVGSPGSATSALVYVNPPGTTGNGVLINSDAIETVSISQILTPAAGQAYTLHFFLTAESVLPGDTTYSGSYPNPVPSGAPIGVSVTLGGAPVNFFQTTAGWNSESLSFVGTGSPVTLTIQDITPASQAGFSPVVSDVFTTTPEPGFYAVLGLGLSGLAAAVLRRRKNQSV